MNMGATLGHGIIILFPALAASAAAIADPTAGVRVSTCDEGIPINLFVLWGAGLGNKVPNPVINSTGRGELWERIEITAALNPARSGVRNGSAGLELGGNQNPDVLQTCATIPTPSQPGEPTNPCGD